MQPAVERAGNGGPERDLDECRVDRASVVESSNAVQYTDVAAGSRDQYGCFSSPNFHHHPSDIRPAGVGYLGLRSSAIPQRDHPRWDEFQPGRYIHQNMADEEHRQLHMDRVRLSVR